MVFTAPHYDKQLLARGYHLKRFTALILDRVTENNASCGNKIYFIPMNVMQCEITM